MKRKEILQNRAGISLSEICKEYIYIRYGILQDMDIMRSSTTQYLAIQGHIETHKLKMENHNFFIVRVVSNICHINGPGERIEKRNREVAACL